jgi:hypothetical protein
MRLTSTRRQPTSAVCKYQARAHTGNRWIHLWPRNLSHCLRYRHLPQHPAAGCTSQHGREGRPYAMLPAQTATASSHAHQNRCFKSTPHSTGGHPTPCNGGSQRTASRPASPHLISTTRHCLCCQEQSAHHLVALVTRAHQCAPSVLRRAPAGTHSSQGFGRLGDGACLSRGPRCRETHHGGSIGIGSSVQQQCTEGGVA